MFVYEFMSGVVDTVRGDDDEFFDPHKRRILTHPTTYTETMIHLLKGSIGAGLLAMPDATRRVGIVYGIIGILAIGAFATYCLQLLIISQYIICKKFKRGYMAYPKSMRLAILEGPEWFRCTGTFFYVMVDAILVVWQIGICAIYFVFVGANVKQVMDYYGMVYTLREVISFLLPLQILINLVKNLKMMTPLSTFSNAVTILGILLVLFYVVENDVEVTDDTVKVKSFLDIPVFVGTTLFAMEAVGVVLALEYNMEQPEHFTGLCGLLSHGMCIILALFTLMGVAGYLKYGDDIKASITLNLPDVDKKAQLAKLSFACALYFSFPLQNFVAYQILWRRISKKWKPSHPMFWDYLLRVVLVIIPFGAALAVPNLGAFISLMGALCLSLVAIIFPGIMDACIWYPDQFGFCKYKLWRDIFIILCGIFSLVAGVYTSILEFTHEAHN